MMVEEFVKTVVKNRKVYYLWLGDGFALFISKVFYIAETQASLPVVYFWDTPDKAEACKTDDWNDGEVKSLSLEEFVDICFQLHTETMAAGINFSADLATEGEEAVPLDVVKQLVKEIERTHTPFTSTRIFTSLTDVKETADEMMPEIEDEEAPND